MELLELTPRQLEVFDFANGLGLKRMSAELVEQTLADLKPVLGSALVIGGLAGIISSIARLAFVSN